VIADIILTIIVLAVAWHCQVPRERVEQILTETEHGAVEPPVAR
jgi:hypothetical protein